jgi:hypothetical protein
VLIYECVGARETTFGREISINNQDFAWLVSGIVSIPFSIQCKASKPTEVMHIQVFPCATESSFFDVCIFYGIESNV